jgi:hypothetical protein
VELNLVSRDDVVLQEPEDHRFLVPVFHTASACPGAATAYLLRRIAYRAGAYAPGIQEALFHELHTPRDGGSVDRVHAWFNARVAELHELGYRLQCRRVTERTAAVLDWVRGGRGYRGAMLKTSFPKLHPARGAAGNNQPDDSIVHAVGLTMDRLEANSDETLVMIDPWPGVIGDAPDRGAVPPALDSAHRDRSYHSLIYYWVGWS